MRARRVIALLAAAGVALSGCGFKGLYSAPLPGGADLGDHPYHLTAYFADVLDLVPQSAVKINDVAEGKVTGISLSECPSRTSDKKVWCAKVKLSVNGSVRLPANARAAVQQTSLLGEKYVALLQPTGPSAAGRLRDGATIKFDDTTSAPEAEQVLGALSLLLNEGGLRQIKSIAIELNKALGAPERQAAVRDLISQLGTFVGTLNGQKDKITGALTSIDALAATLNKQKSVLTDALVTFPGALKALREETPKLVTLLTSLSNLGVVANRVINSTQDQLVAALKSLDPVVTRLAAAGDDFPKALRILGTFPFPVGTTRNIIKGDYANLDAVLDLNLTDELCGILGVCATAAKQGATALKRKTGGSTASAKTAPNTLPPTLLGAGK